MKGKKKMMIAAVTASVGVLGSLGLVACSKSNTKPGGTTLQLSETDAVMYVGEKTNVTATASDTEGQAIVWSADTDAVALTPNVDGSAAEVEAVKAGASVVTASVAGVSASYTVTVKNITQVSDISVAYDNDYLPQFGAGDTLEFAKITATAGEEYEYRYTIKYGDESEQDLTTDYVLDERGDYTVTAYITTRGASGKGMLGFSVVQAVNDIVLKYDGNDSATFIKGQTLQANNVSATSSVASENSLDIAYRIVTPSGEKIVLDDNGYSFATTGAYYLEAFISGNAEFSGSVRIPITVNNKRQLSVTPKFDGGAATDIENEITEGFDLSKLGYAVSETETGTLDAVWKIDGVAVDTEDSFEFDATGEHTVSVELSNELCEGSASFTVTVYKQYAITLDAPTENAVTDKTYTFVPSDTGDAETQLKVKYGSGEWQAFDGEFTQTGSAAVKAVVTGEYNRGESAEAPITVYERGTACSVYAPAYAHKLLLGVAETVGGGAVGAYDTVTVESDKIKIGGAYTNKTYISLYTSVASVTDGGTVQGLKAGRAEIALLLDGKVYSLGEYEVADYSGYKAISTVADWNALPTDTDSGNYVLVDDIDFGGTDIPKKFCANGWNTTSGMRGIFDGNGYAIKNGKVAGDGEKVGLIQQVSGTLRNIKFLNIVRDTAVGNYSGIVTCFLTGTMENVYAEVKINAGWTGTRDALKRQPMQSFGALVGVIYGSYSMKNCVANISTDKESLENVAGLIGGLWWYDTTPNNVTNSYTICTADIPTIDAYGSWLYTGDTSDTRTTNEEVNFKYNSFAAFAQANGDSFATPFWRETLDIAPTDVSSEIELTYNGETTLTLPNCVIEFNKVAAAHPSGKFYFTITLPNGSVEDLTSDYTVASGAGTYTVTAYLVDPTGANTGSKTIAFTVQGQDISADLSITKDGSSITELNHNLGKEFNLADLSVNKGEHTVDTYWTVDGNAVNGSTVIFETTGEHTIAAVVRDDTYSGSVSLTVTVYSYALTTDYTTIDLTVYPTNRVKDNAVYTAPDDTHTIVAPSVSVVGGVSNVSTAITAYNTSDSEIASVEDGKLIPHKNGTVTVYAVIDGVDVEFFTVNVTSYVDYKALIDKEDWNALPDSGNDSTNYILMSDIDFGGAEIPKKFNSGNAGANRTTGYCGIFDGNGYAIKNGKIAGESNAKNIALIHQLSGTLRNIKFLNIVREESVGDYSGAVVGFLTGRMENVFATVKINAGWSGMRDALKRQPMRSFGALVGNAYASSYSMENCVAHIYTDKTELQNVAGLMGGLGWSAGSPNNIVNSFAICAVDIPTIDAYGNWLYTGDTEDTRTSNESVNFMYNSFDAFIAAQGGKFDTSFWNDAFGYPVFAYSTDAKLERTVYVGANANAADWLVHKPDGTTFSSSDDQVLSVDEATGALTAQKGGTVVITASNGEKTATVNVNVQFDITVSNEISEVTLYQARTLDRVSGGTATLTAKSSYMPNMTVKANQDGATVPTDRKFISSDSNVITVNETTGVVTFAGVGTATVSVEISGETYALFTVNCIDYSGYKAISDVADWNALPTANSTANYVLTNDLDFNNEVVSAKFLRGGDGQWNNTSGLKHIFDGNGFAIKNFTAVKTHPSNDEWRGLIGQVAAGGTIRNIKFLGVTGASTNGGTRTGGVISFLCGKAENIYAEVSINTVNGNYTSAGSSSPENSVGGLIGILLNETGVTLKNVIVKATVDSNITDTKSIGGVLGAVGWETIADYVSNCYVITESNIKAVAWLDCRTDKTNGKWNADIGFNSDYSGEVPDYWATYNTTDALKTAQSAKFAGGGVFDTLFWKECLTA